MRFLKELEKQLETLESQFETKIYLMTLDGGHHINLVLNI
jgi:hypothetical protein